MPPKWYFLSVSHFRISPSFDSLYRGSISLLHINQSDSEREETGLLSKYFYCFQRKVQPCVFLFHLCSNYLWDCLGWVWNISKFPEEESICLWGVAGEGTSVNYLDSLYNETVIWKQKQCLFWTTSLFPNCWWIYEYVLGASKYLSHLISILFYYVKKGDFEVETEIVSPCFQSVTIYCRTSVAGTLMAHLP